MEKNIEKEKPPYNFESLIKIVEGITPYAQKTLEETWKHLNALSENKLANPKTKTTPKKEIERYLSAIENKYPDINGYINALITDKKWSKKCPPQLVITIPVVGFGEQEHETVKKTINALKKDPLIERGEAGVIFFVNRPEKKKPDETGDLIKTFCENNDVNYILLEGEIPNKLGVEYSDLLHLVGGDHNVPIALIRQILTTVAMKIYQENNTLENIPPILQLDGDLKKLPSLENILQKFYENGDKKVQTAFMQCACDWRDWENPEGDEDLKNELPFELGAMLMLELPFIVKDLFASIEEKEQNPEQLIKWVQATFGELVQRGTQVPQIMNPGDLAKLGGIYGFSRMGCDEHDLLVRMFALANVFGITGRIKALEKDPFIFDPRRAINAYIKNDEPPINQWLPDIPFQTEDPVRNSSDSDDYLKKRTPYTKLKPAEKEEALLKALNKTLQRMPVDVSFMNILKERINGVIKAFNEKYPSDQIHLTEYDLSAKEDHQENTFILQYNKKL